MALVAFFLCQHHFHVCFSLKNSIRSHLAQGLLAVMINFSLMALWIASYQDGSWRDRHGRTYHRHRLPFPAWLEGRLLEYASYESLKQVVHQCGVKRDMPAEYDGVRAHLLVRLSSSVESCTHSHGFDTRWDPETNLLLDYFANRDGEVPLDAYSVEIAEVLRCASPNAERLCYYWAKEQHAKLRRKHTGANMNARTRMKLSPANRHLAIADWCDTADEVKLGDGLAGQARVWQWGGLLRAENDHADAVRRCDEPAVLSSDSDDTDSNADAAMLSDDSSGQAQQATRLRSAASVVQDWNLGIPAGEVPVLLLPEPIVCLIANSRWTHLLLRAAWHEHVLPDVSSAEASSESNLAPLFRTIPNWPPADSLVWQNIGQLGNRHGFAKDDLQNVPDMNSEALESIADQLRAWTGPILNSTGTAAARESERAKILQIVQNLDSWAVQLKECEQPTATLVPQCRRRWRHSTSKVLSSIRVAHMVRGGASKLAGVVKHTLSLIAPAFLVGPLMRGLQQDEAKMTVLPGASTIRRNELALDISLTLWRKRTYQKEVCRFAWSDSSPMANYDWVWCQVHEVPRCKLVSTCKAAHELIHTIQAYVMQLQKDGSEIGLDDDAMPSLSSIFEVPPHWVPLLQELLNISEYIYPPSSMTSGHRGLVHNVSSLVYQFWFDKPTEVSLEEYTDTFECHTSDFGVDTGASELELQTFDDILPPWINQSPLRTDIDVPECIDSDDEDQLVAVADDAREDAGGAALQAFVNSHSVLSLPNKKKISLFQFAISIFLTLQLIDVSSNSKLEFLRLFA